jgi:hypothetical protein
MGPEHERRGIAGQRESIGSRFRVFRFKCSDWVENTADVVSLNPLSQLRLVSSSV